MLYRINNAVAHQDHTVTITWSDGVTATVDLSPVISKGNVFAPLSDGVYFVEKMRIAQDRLGLEWPNRVDFSADGLRFRAFLQRGKSSSASLKALPLSRTSRTIPCLEALPVAPITYVLVIRAWQSAENHRGIYHA